MGATNRRRSRWAMIVRHQRAVTVKGQLSYSPCPLCEGRQVITIAILRTSHSIISCTNCGIAWTYPAPRLCDDDYAADRVNEASGYLAREDEFRAFQARIIAFMRRRVGVPAPTSRLLEVGCNIGLFLDLVQQEGYA